MKTSKIIIRRDTLISDIFTRFAIVNFNSITFHISKLGNVANGFDFSFTFIAYNTYGQQQVLHVDARVASGKGFHF